MLKNKVFKTLILSILFATFFISVDVTFAQSLNIEYPPIPVPGPGGVQMFNINDAIRLGKVDVPQLIILIYAGIAIFTGVAAFLTLIYAGAVYIVSGGNPGKRKAAFQKFKNVMLGLGIILFSWFALYIINPNIIDLERSLVLQSISDEGPGFLSFTFTNPEPEDTGTYNCEWVDGTCQVGENNCTAGYAAYCGDITSDVDDASTKCGQVINARCTPGDGSGGGAQTGDGGTFDCVWKPDESQLAINPRAGECEINTDTTICNANGEPDPSVCESQNFDTCNNTTNNACTYTGGGGGVPSCSQHPSGCANYTAFAGFARSFTTDPPGIKSGQNSKEDLDPKHQSYLTYEPTANKGPSYPQCWGADCGTFVSTVVQNTIDPDFPDIGTANIQNYFNGAGKDKYTYINNDPLDTSRIRPGDILLSRSVPGHVSLWLDDSIGVGEYEAALGSRTVSDCSLSTFPHGPEDAPGSNMVKIYRFNGFIQ